MPYFRPSHDFMLITTCTRSLKMALPCTVNIYWAISASCYTFHQKISSFRTITIPTLVYYFVLSTSDERGMGLNPTRCVCP